MRIHPPIEQQVDTLVRQTYTYRCRHEKFKLISTNTASTSIQLNCKSRESYQYGMWL